MDKIIANALQFWYKSTHSLYGDPLPALMGIVGESGELCEIWKKKLYKPGYEFSRDEFLDELGDCLFYTAILVHYDGLTIDYLNSIVWCWDKPRCVETYIAELNYRSANWLSNGIHSTLRMLASIKLLCLEFDITIDQLSEMNYAKLNERARNGEGYNRGEEKEQMYTCNRADDCGVECWNKAPHDSNDDIDDCFNAGCISSGLPDAVCVPVQCSE